MHKAMAKTGYLLTTSGLVLLIRPAIRVFFGAIDVLELAHLLIGATLSVVGLALLWGASTSFGLAWKSLWTYSLQSGKDRVAMALIILGAFGLPIILAYIWSPESTKSSLPFLALTLPALIIGWALAFSTFGQSRSPQK